MDGVSLECGDCRRFCARDSSRLPCRAQLSCCSRTYNAKSFLVGWPLAPAHGTFAPAEYSNSCDCTLCTIASRRWRRPAAGARRGGSKRPASLALPPGSVGLAFTASRVQDGAARRRAAALPGMQCGTPASGIPIDVEIRVSVQSVFVPGHSKEFVHTERVRGTKHQAVDV